MIQLLFQSLAIFLQGDVYFHIGGHDKRCRTVSVAEDSRFVPTHTVATWYDVLHVQKLFVDHQRI